MSNPSSMDYNWQIIKKFDMMFKFTKLMKKSIIISFILMLSGCEKAINRHNMCALFKDNTAWYQYHKYYEQKYKVPMAITLAIIEKESGFKAHARPVKTWLIKNVIPWEYASSSYGYAQALNGSWSEFQKAHKGEYHVRSAYKSNVAFINWYLHKYADRYKSVEDKYLIYHNGPYSNPKKAKQSVLHYAKEVAKKANTYDKQLKQCKLELDWHLDWGPLR